MIFYSSISICVAFQRGIMPDDYPSIFCKMDIRFDDIHPELHSREKSGEGVLRIEF